MPKSSRRDKVEGWLDMIAARVLALFSRLSGNRGAGAKATAARARGQLRTAKGGLKHRLGR
jgi:hypothetical protein